MICTTCGSFFRHDIQHYGRHTHTGQAKHELDISDMLSKASAHPHSLLRPEGTSSGSRYQGHEVEGGERGISWATHGNKERSAVPPAACTMGWGDLQCDYSIIMLRAFF